jgi:hypothetical protein
MSLTPRRRSPKKAPQKTRSRKPALRKSGRKTGRRWSAKVTANSDAMDLKQDVFKSDSPKRIAASLKRSAKQSDRRKSTAFRSAMSMLNFYINRAGKNLSTSRRRILEAAKVRLRRVFRRPARTQPTR